MGLGWKIVGANQTDKHKTKKESAFKYHIISHFKEVCNNFANTGCNTRFLFIEDMADAEILQILK